MGSADKDVQEQFIAYFSIRTSHQRRSEFLCEMSSFLNNSPKDRLSLNGFCMLIVSRIDDGGLVESVRFSGGTLFELQKSFHSSLKFSNFCVFSLRLFCSTGLMRSAPPPLVDVLCCPGVCLGWLWPGRRAGQGGQKQTTKEQTTHT